MSTASTYTLKFGKHANKPLSEVPSDYLVYILNKNESLYESVKNRICEYLNEIGVSTELKQNDDKPSGSDYVFTYGKHKGLKVRDCPIEYLQWTLKNEKTVQGIKNHINKHFESIA